MNATALQLPPPQLARLSVQLSADIYLPRAELQAKYPGAIIIPGGCDRGMVVRLEVSDQRPEASPTSYVFVVFEGTHDLKSLIADLAVKRHPYAGGEIHSGFDDGLMSMWDDILVAIHALARPGDLLVWSGHSRGASQCEDAACRWESLLAGPNPPSGPETAWILPFAPARLGNVQFRDSYNAILGHKTFFYHHGADIVPWLPGWLMGNRQVGHRVWFPDRLPLLAVALLGEEVLDPSLPPLALNLAMLLYRQRAIGLEALLADHHVDTYVQLLT